MTRDYRIDEPPGSPSTNHAGISSESSPDSATGLTVSSADRSVSLQAFFNEPVAPPSAHCNRIQLTANSSESRSMIPLANLSDCSGSPFVNSSHGSRILSANSSGAANGPVNSGQSTRERFRRLLRFSFVALLIVTVPPVVIWDLALRDVQPVNSREPPNATGASVHLYCSG